MDNIICYASGGLGNRIIPLLCCMSRAEQYGMRVNVCWHGQLRCISEFEELFDNAFPNLKYEDIPKLNDISYYSKDDAAFYENKLNGVNSLLEVQKKNGVKDHLTFKYPTSNNIVFANSICLGVSLGEMKSQFKNLVFNKDIREILDREEDITKDYIGVHIRGTDFETNSNNESFLKSYTDQMDSLISNDSNARFYICSDSKQYEDALKNAYGSRVVCREGKTYVQKQDETKGWTNNVSTPLDSLKDSMVDLIMLSQSTIRVYNKQSSFAKLAMLVG
jgi:hypothetical protein